MVGFLRVWRGLALVGVVLGAVACVPGVSAADSPLCPTVVASGLAAQPALDHGPFICAVSSVK